MKHIQRPIGVHIRIQNSLLEAFEKAEQLAITTFQVFISINGVGQKLHVDSHQVKQFIEKKDTVDSIFFHASYKSNPASCTVVHHYVLEQEIRLATRLGIPSLVLHPGATGCATKIEAIDALARTLNRMQKRDSEIVFVLENVAHGTTAVGGDIHDFGILLPKLEYPERIKFCIDTAHAFCYGYDIYTQEGREEFIRLVGIVLGFEKIAVLHINDTREQRGSMHDQHAVLGAGTIGKEALAAFATHRKLAHIPLILELPVIPEEECKNILALVKTW